ncbi:MAG: RNA polymerase sigma factor [Anaerolineae bacterium]|nr:RNA polymerase sigma factor [Anaerolineae bacterium]
MTTPHLRFETLIERYHDEIFRYLWRMLQDSPHEPQDVTQETFMRAYQAFGRLRPDSNHRAWLYKIATNCAYSVLRRSQRENSLDDLEIMDGQPAPDQQVIELETLQAATRIIQRLPVKQRAAVIMRHLEGCDYTEIAHVLDCSEDSARANVSQAIRRLRRELQNESGEA